MRRVSAREVKSDRFGVRRADESERSGGVTGEGRGFVFVSQSQPMRRTSADSGGRQMQFSREKRTLADTHVHYLTHPGSLCPGSNPGGVI
jgi:hypothetical protein